MNKPKSRTKRTRASSRYREAALRRATESLLGQSITEVSFPGGKSRESCLMCLANGDTVVATRRKDLARARLEVQILQALNRHQVAVPQMLGTNHSHILLQEAMQGERLSSVLNDADEVKSHTVLHDALSSLLAIQQAATAEALESHVSVLGNSEKWIKSFIRRPSIIGKYLGVEAPTLDTEKLLALLKVLHPRFIKWDARPGNAVVDEQNRVAWFDWEHAGKRNRLDDVAWLLGDEFIPEMPASEQALLAEFLPAFGDPMTVDSAHQYLMAYGTFHMSVRLGLILKYMDGEWWDLQHCISNDKVGVTLLCAQRLCQRGARWSAANPLTQSLSAWFVKVESAIVALPAK